VKQARVKRSKLYYLRDRVGKAALKAGIQIPAEGEYLETQQLEIEEDTTKEQDEESKEKVEKEEKKDEKDQSSNK